MVRLLGLGEVAAQPMQFAKLIEGSARCTLLA
jgi:hypothetical protein